MEYDAFSSTSTQALIPCDICGRNFNPDALTRHTPICAKSQAKKRKIFDSSKQRADGTELKQFQKTAGRGKTQIQQPKQKQPAPAPSKGNWRQKHEDFINAIRSAKGVQQAIERGEPLPPPPPPSINPDYVQCEYCSRRFNQTAAERHVSFCREQHNRLPAAKKVTNEAMQRAQARQYKGPKLRKNPPVTSPPGSGGYSYSTSARTGPGSRSNAGTSNYSSPGHSTDGSVVNGRALRTGRTAETYSEARELSAKQRQNMPTKSSPQVHDHDERPRYGGLGSTNTGPTRAVRNGDPGYHSVDNTQHRVTPGGRGSYHSSESDHHRAPPGGRGGSGSARFCHECGTKYPVTAAKFCCECGVRRMNVS